MWVKKQLRIAQHVLKPQVKKPEVIAAKPPKRKEPEPVLERPVGVGGSVPDLIPQLGDFSSAQY